MKATIQLIIVCVLCFLCAMPAAGKNNSDEIPAKTKEAILKSLSAFAEDQFASALSHCEKAMASSPKNVEILLICMKLYQRNERHVEALAISSKIRKLDKNADNDNELCFLDGISLYKLHRWDEAIASYEHCTSGDSAAEQSISLGNLAEIYMVKGDLQGAETKYLQARQLDPTNIHALFGLVVDLERQNKLDEARKLFLEGIQLDPQLYFFKNAFFEPQGEVDYHRAVMAYLGARYEDAAFYLKRYMSFEQPPEFMKKAEELLKRIQVEPAPRVAFYPVLKEGITSVAVDSALKFLAIGTIEGGIYVVDLSRQRVMTLQNTGSAPIHYAGIKDSQLRALGGNTIYIADLKQSAPALYYYTLQDFEALGMQTADDRVLLTRGEDLFVANLKNLQEKQQIHELSEIEELDRLSKAQVKLFARIAKDPTSPSSHHFAMPSSWGTRRIVVVHPKKAIFALGSEQMVLLFNEEGEVLRVLLQNPLNITRTLSFDESGEYLVVASSGIAEIWSLKALGIF